VALHTELLRRARIADEQDELAPFRDRFVIDDPDLIYLDGNSLGRLPKATQDLMRTQVENGWGQRLIRAWNEGWISAPQRIGAKIASLIGAQPDEVIMADSTSVNLFKLVSAALRAQPERTKIVTDDLNFPSDLYVLQGICQSLSRRCEIQVVASEDGIHGPMEGLAQAIDGETALVTLSHTVFKSGYTYDMEAVTAMAHSAGALVIWDLSHSAGAVPVDLNRAAADLAIGCTYKYLNGGPGAPAFLYVRGDLQEKLANPIAGWMGQNKPFDFELTYEPAAGLSHFLSGSPPILSMSAIEPGVDLLVEAGIERLRAKSVSQSEFLIELWRTMLSPLGFTLNSPPDPDVRGSHISLGHEEGLRIDLALINEKKVLPDFRYPDNIRLGITPLYTSFSDLFEATVRLRAVVTERLYENYSGEGVLVT
jgi:kynureninase